MGEHMKNTYKILIACGLTAIVTAFITTIVVKNQYEMADVPEFVCKDNASPDINGCCPGEEYKDTGNQIFACCPTDGGECFPPIIK